MCPVKRYGEESQAGGDTEEVGEDDVLGGEPGDDVEVGEAGGEKPGDEVPEEGGDEDDVLNGYIMLARFRNQLKAPRRPGRGKTR